MSSSKNGSYLAQPQDKPTRVASLGWRILYTFISWLVLGEGILPGRGFFVSLILFIFPLLMDYLKFVPDTGFRSFLRYAGIIISSVWLLIGIIGTFGILSIVDSQHHLRIMIDQNYIVLGGASFPVSIIWWFIGINVVLTVVDWVFWECEIEKRIREGLRKAGSMTISKGNEG